MTTCAAQMQRTENALAEAPRLRDQMITEHLPLVRAIAMRVHGNRRYMWISTICFMPAFWACSTP